ncbi:MAG: SRPBCC family protein [Flavobacteriales bacterium]
MKLDGYKSKVNKSQEAVFEFLQETSNFEKLMPDDLSFFEARDTGFSFQLTSIPIKIVLKKKEAVEFSRITYESAGSIHFKLNAYLTKIEEEKTDIEFVFEGQLNPMIRMMTEKPLKKLLEVFSTSIEKI